MATLSAYLKTWRLKRSHAKTVMAASHLHYREVQRELKVYANDKLLSFCQVPIYLGVKLYRSLSFHHHQETWCKVLSTGITLQRRLAGSGWVAGATTLGTVSLSLVCFTAEYCAPVWCPSAHTRLIDSVLNDTLSIVNACLSITPTEDMPILAGIQPDELHRLRATLSFAKRGTLAQTIFYTVN